MITPALPEEDEIRGQLIRRRGERFPETQYAIVAAVGNVKVSLIHCQSRGSGETGR